MKQASIHPKEWKLVSLRECPTPAEMQIPKIGRIRCRKDLGGLLNYYYREAA